MDRQTDRQTRATWWSITAYNREIETLEGWIADQKLMPSWLKRIYGGREICPNTGRVHFQGAINTAQIRMSTIKDVLPTTHIERAIRKDALVKYAMKEETADGEKAIATNQGYATIPEVLD